jgi:uncharacterized protein (DUF1330 family)
LVKRFLRLTAASNAGCRRSRAERPSLAFGGRFIVHGGEVEVLEGRWPGHLIVIEFPDRGRASAWYNSGAYREIVALRTDNSESDVIMVDGVGSEHKATDVLAVSG